MKDSIFDLAKAIANSEPGKLQTAIRNAGFGSIPQARAIRDLSEALVSVWDGKASTLDQATAWRQVWAYCASYGLVRGSMNSHADGVLDAIEALRTKAAPQPEIHTVAASLTLGELPAKVEEWRKNNPGIATLWPSPISAPEAMGDSQFHPTGPMEPTGGVLVHRITGDRIKLVERQECVNGWQVVTDFGCEFFASAVHYRMEFPKEEAPHGHVLFKDGDSDIPNAIKDRNGQVALSMCRYCGAAESELEDDCCIPPKPRTNREIRMDAAMDKLAEVVEPGRLEVMGRLLVLQDTCYGLAKNAGWWKDLETAVDVREWPKVHLDNWVSAKLMLIVTEVAEAMEGHRKGLMDDKLPHRGMLEVELADAVIRIMDLAGGLHLDVAGAIVEKLVYNMTREDHKIENRKAAGGKSV